MPETTKSALIAGSTGLVGSELLQYILDRTAYEKVKLFVRRPLTIKHPKLEQIVVDFDHLDQYKENFQVDDVYCCLGTTIKKAKTKEAFQKVDQAYPLELARLSAESGVQKFLIISSMGADPKSSIFYSRVKGQVEAELQRLNLTSLHIFRPSLLLGERQEFRLGEKVAEVLAPIYSFALVGAMRKYKPIQAKDVAFAMYLTAQKPLTGTFIYESDQIQQRSKTGH
jgi:uncharacterized protein YbjT (DUF2867 family)